MLTVQAIEDQETHLGEYVRAPRSNNSQSAHERKGATQQTLLLASS